MKTFGVCIRYISMSRRLGFADYTDCFECFFSTGFVEGSLQVLVFCKGHFKDFVSDSKDRRLVFFLFSMKFCFGSTSLMSKVSYHHNGATPLMLAILTGKFSAASILLRAGARVDLRNARIMAESP